MLSFSFICNLLNIKDKIFLKKNLHTLLPLYTLASNNRQ